MPTNAPHIHSHTHPISNPTTVIDLEAMGFGGVMPTILDKALKSNMAEEKPLWDSLMTDPIARRFVENPMAAAKIAIEVAQDFAAQASFGNLA